MNLHEQYQTLLDRGMPKHPRVRWFVMTMGVQSWCNDRGPVEEADARDLITMHAIRWLVGTVAEAKENDHQVAFETDTTVRVNLLDGDWQDHTFNYSNDALAAIIAATENLRP
jgi:hypothetical protein